MIDRLSKVEKRGERYSVSRLLVLATIFWLAIFGSTQFLRHRIHSRATIGIKRLDSIVPVRFGDWTLTSDGATPIVNPQLQESLANTYDETLSRTYVNQVTGNKVMLSLAYGADQSHEKQVHKPEVCYAAQGFSIEGVSKIHFQLAGKQIPVTMLTAINGARNEQVVYWIVEGDRIVRGALQQNFERAWLALHGIQEDGLLFRVSILSTDKNSSEATLEQFADELVRAEAPGIRLKLLGSVDRSEREP